MRDLHSVLLVTDALEVGGVEKVVVGLANALHRSGLDVGVAAGPGGALWSRLDAAVDRYSGRITGAPVIGHLRYAVWLRRVVRHHGFQIVHTHQRGVSLMARLGLAGTGVPVVEHVHSHFAAGVSRRLLSFRGHVLIGCSRSVGRMLVDDFGRRPSQVRVIPNAVDDVGTHVRSDPARPSSGRKRILAVGRLSDVKDPLRFVGVINALVARGWAVEGEWVGDGPLRSEVEREIDRTGAPVTLSGHSDDVPEKLHGADVMLMTSRFEGMPLVVLEAMSLSRVVVAPDVGGLSELVVDGVTGVVYHPGADTAEIASRIAGVLAVPEVRADMEREARARFVALSDMETMVESVRAVYGDARKELHGERDG